MSLNNKTVNVPNLLYYLAYFLLVFQSMTRWVLIDGISTMSSICNKIIPLILLLVFIIRNKKTTKSNILIIMVLVMLILISMKISKGTAILNIILFIITAKGMDIDKVIKFDLVIKLILIILVYILYINGLTEYVVIYRNDSSVLRYGLGFGHPNTFSVYLMSICLDFLYLKFKSKQKKFAYLAIVLAIIFISKYCDSRSSIYTLTIALIISLFAPLIKKNKIISNMFSNIPIIFMIVSLLATIMYKYKKIFTFMPALNEIFSNRILLMYQFYEKYSINIFGNYFIDYHTQSTATGSVLDNAYILLLLKFGILITIIIILAISKRVKKSLKDGNMGLVVCLTSFAFFGLMENGMIVLFYNPFLLFLSHLIFDNKKKGELNENK